MKNVLFATTALIATAGIASAEVSLSGSAEMGIIGGDQGIAGYTASLRLPYHACIRREGHGA